MGEAGDLSVPPICTAGQRRVWYGVGYAYRKYLIRFSLSARAQRPLCTRESGGSFPAWNPPHPGFLQTLIHPLRAVSQEDREKAKRVTYGIVYGISPAGLAAQLKDQGVDVPAAGRLINAFLQHFSGVRTFMARCVRTLLFYKDCKRTVHRPAATDGSDGSHSDGLDSGHAKYR